MHLFVVCVSAGGARVSVAALALLTSSSAACAAGGVCALVAKRARCCASGPRPLLRVPWAPARGVTRIDALFEASHVLCVAARGVFHRVFAQACIVKVRRRVASANSCVRCSCDARRCVVRFYVLTATSATAFTLTLLFARVRARENANSRTQETSGTLGVRISNRAS